MFDKEIVALSAPETMAFVPAGPEGRGRIFMLSYPGLLLGHDGSTYLDPRDLHAVLHALAAAGTGTLVLLPQDSELPENAPAQLEAEARDLGILPIRLPVADFGIPDEQGETAWADLSPRLRAELAKGQSIGIACLSGIGRSPSFTARLLCEIGMGFEEAVALIRDRIPDAIETHEQMCWAATPGI